MKRAQVLNREQTVNNLPGFLIVLFIVSACTHTNVSTVNETRVFEFYAKAALYELCSKGILGYEKNCKQVNEHLLDLRPEIYFFENAKKKEVLVIFDLNDFNPSVVLRYKEGGGFQIIEVLFNAFSWKQERIDAFIAGGDLAGDHSE